MKKNHPSNLVILVFLSISLIFILFGIGALINHFLRIATDSDNGLEEPNTELLNEVE